MKKTYFEKYIVIKKIKLYKKIKNRKE